MIAENAQLTRNTDPGFDNLMNAAVRVEKRLGFTKKKKKTKRADSYKDFDSNFDEEDIKLDSPDDSKFDSDLDLDMKSISKRKKRRRRSLLIPKRRIKSTRKRRCLKMISF